VAPELALAAARHPFPLRVRPAAEHDARVALMKER
jgi:hypothetical protein